MLNNYYEQLQKLIELLGHGKHMDLGLYLQTIKLTALIILETVGGIIAASALIAGPVYLYKRVIKKYNADLGACGAEKQKVDAILRKTTRFKIAFALGIVFIYIPFAIPTILLFM